MHSYTTDAGVSFAYNSDGSGPLKIFGVENIEEIENPNAEPDHMAEVSFEAVRQFVAAWTAGQQEDKPESPALREAREFSEALSIQDIEALVEKWRTKLVTDLMQGQTRGIKLLSQENWKVWEAILEERLEAQYEAETRRAEYAEKLYYQTGQRLRPRRRRSDAGSLPRRLPGAALGAELFQLMAEGLAELRQAPEQAADGERRLAVYLFGSPEPAKTLSDPEQCAAEGHCVCSKLFNIKEGTRCCGCGEPLDATPQPKPEQSDAEK